MSETLAQFIDRALSPKSRWSYALWIVLLFNGIAGQRKGRYDLAYFGLYGVQAIFFGLLWIVGTLSRLRESSWSLWWTVPFTFTWFGVIWIFLWDPGRIAIAILAVWFIAQSFLILKNDRPSSDAKVAEENS